VASLGEADELANFLQLLSESGDLALQVWPWR
jgi:hypothetical protein